MSAREVLIQPYAHIPPRSALDGLTADQASRRLPAAPHSIAEITAHMDFWLRWFLKRCQGTAEPLAATAAQGWPQPDPDWEFVLRQFLAGLDAAVEFFEQADPLAPVTPPIEFPPLSRYTLLEAQEHAAQHNAHHLGQIVTLRQMMGLWPPPAGSYTW
jgi:uncharacterized damage-inducible protein DinB